MPRADSINWATAAPWKAEIERSKSVAEPYWSNWEDNLQAYIGKSKDAVLAQADNRDYVNVPTDYTNIRVKVPQLFFDTPELQMTARGAFKAPRPAAQLPGQPPAPPAPDPAPIVAAHRALLNELLGPDEANVLQTIERAIKECLLTSGEGATKIAFYATTEDIPTPPEIGAVLGLRQDTIPRPVDECYSWDRVPAKKFRKPADFKDNDFDKSPWLAMGFRMPLAVAKRQFKLPSDFEGTKERDEMVLNDLESNRRDVSDIPYVDGHEVWYYAHIFDKDALNPKLIRRHVLVDGVDGFVERSNENPFQELLPNGRLTADSMIGYPLHILSLDWIPDSSFVPSESSIIRPLVREQNKFRTQQVQERDANIPRVLLDSEVFTEEVIAKIQDGSVGSMVLVEPGALRGAGGAQGVMAQVIQGTQTRGSYAANEQIERDIQRALGLDDLGVGIKSGSDPTATEISSVDRQRNVRLDGDRRKVLSWYLKGVAKFSALVCRFMRPEDAARYIGEEAAQVWGSWDKKLWDGRFVFDAKPDSQLKLDAAAERKFHMDLYQFTAKDPNVNRLPILKKLYTLGGIDPADVIVEQLPEKGPEPPSISLAVGGEDLVAPQAQQVREILAKAGVEISQEAIQTSADQMFQQIALGIRDADGKAVKASAGPNGEHGGTATQVRPLSKQSSDKSGDRSGPKV